MDESHSECPQALRASRTFLFRADYSQSFCSMFMYAQQVTRRTWIMPTTPCEDPSLCPHTKSMHSGGWREIWRRQSLSQLAQLACFLVTLGWRASWGRSFRNKVCSRGHPRPLESPPKMVTWWKPANGESFSIHALSSNHFPVADINNLDCVLQWNSEILRPWSNCGILRGNDRHLEASNKFFANPLT